MNICLEGPNGEWDWFEADLREPDLGISREQVKSLCGTTNPQVIDIEYDDDEPYKELLQYDGMGWTSLDSLVNQAEQLAQFEDYELEQIAAYMNTKSGDLSYAMDHFDNHQYWKTDNSNIEDFAKAYLEDTGYDADFLARYFDYAALGEELLDDPDYEPLSDNGNAWDEGELYIDNMYGSVEDFIANHDLDTVFDYYFDLDGFANGNLRYSFDYDDQTGIWVSESVNRKFGKRKLRESRSDKIYTGKTWKDFINNLELNSNYKVDSVYRRRYDQWIELIDNNGNIYDAEVTMYKDRFGNNTYELVDYNITPSYQEGTYEECITEDWDPEEYGVVLDKNTAIFLDEYTFNPNSNWTKIWQSVIQPLIDKYFNAYDNWEDDLDFKINLFYDVFADKYPNVKRACNKFWDENDI